MTSGSEQPERVTALHLVGVVGFVLVVGLTSLTWPMGRDQGIYAYTGWAWLQGLEPYRDVYVFKPPGTVLLHTLAVAVFGADMIAIRLLDWLVQAATAAGLVSVVAAWTERPRIGLAAGLLYAPAYYRFGFWGTAQTDAWFVPCVVLALWALTRSGPSDRPRSWAALAGLSLGFALVLKYTALAFVLPALVPLLYHRRWGSHDWGPTVTLLGAMVVPWALTILWLVAGGAWPDFVDCQGLLVSYADHVPKVGFAEATRLLATGIPPLGLSRVMLVGALGLPVVWRRGDAHQRAGVALWLAWFLAASASLVSQGRYFGYHAVPLLPALVWAGAMVLAWATAPLGKWANLAVLALVAYLAVPHPIRTWDLLAQAATDRRTLYADHFYPRVGKYKEAGYEPFLEVADHLRENASPDEPVYVWGYDPVVMFLAERRQSTRYLYNFPMVAGWQDGTDRARFMAEIRDDPPVVFAVASGDPTPKATANPLDSRASFDEWTELRDWVEAHYLRQPNVMGYRVYHRLGRP